MLVREELRRFADRGLRAHVWLRDDDATAITPALTRLGALARTYGVHVGLAVIPGKLELDLTRHLHDLTHVFIPMCHGWMHTDHKTEPGPAEFGTHRNPTDMLDDLTSAYAVYASNFETTRPVFVPPFGQFAPVLESALPGLGFGALSNGPGRQKRRLTRVLGASAAVPQNPLGFMFKSAPLEVQIDPINWHTGTAKADEDIARALLGELRARRLGFIPIGAPIGLLTHHLVHDEPIWQACTKLLDVLCHSEAVQFPNLWQLIESAQQRTATLSPKLASSMHEGSPLA